MLILLLMMSVFSNAVAEEPIRINLTFLGAVIGPTKENGAPWDGPARIDTRTLSTVQNLMAPGSGMASSAIINTVSQLARQGTAAPDVIGYVEQIGSTIRDLANTAGIPIALATKQNMTRDSYTPQFSVTYEGWPIFKDSRFQIHLWDADLFNNDAIGVVEITYNDIMQAIKNGKTTWIKVSDQSFNQVLFIQISADKALSNTQAKIDGYRFP